MTPDTYTTAYDALCDAEEAEAPAYAAYLATMGAPAAAIDAAFAVWWPLRVAREAAYEALRALPVPSGEVAA